MPVKADRALNIAKMRVAQREGLSHAAFVRRLRFEGITPMRRTDSLAHWANVSKIERKTGLLKYVRKDYYPTEKLIAQVTWKLSKEFMYVCNVRKRAAPDQPVTERRVNITSDVPMTPRMVEQAVVEKWSEWERYIPEIIEEVIPFTAVHRSELWQA